MLPNPRFSRGIGLVLKACSREKSTVAGCGFGASFYAHVAILGLVLKLVVITSCTCYIKSRHILNLIIYRPTVNYQLNIPQCPAYSYSLVVQTRSPGCDEREGLTRNR